MCYAIVVKNGRHTVVGISLLFFYAVPEYNEICVCIRTDFIPYVYITVFFSSFYRLNPPRTLRWTFWDTIYNTQFIQMSLFKGYNVEALNCCVIFYLNRIRRQIFSKQRVSIEIKMLSYIHLKFFINKHLCWRFERYFTIIPLS